MHTLFPKEVYFIHSKYCTFLTLTSPYNTLLIKIPILEEESSQVILQVGRGALKSSVSCPGSHSNGKKDQLLWPHGRSLGS